MRLYLQVPVKTISKARNWTHSSNIDNSIYKYKYVFYNFYAWFWIGRGNANLQDYAPTAAARSFLAYEPPQHGEPGTLQIKRALRGPIPPSIGACAVAPPSRQKPVVEAYEGLFPVATSGPKEGVPSIHKKNTNRARDYGRVKEGAGIIRRFLSLLYMYRIHS